MTIVDVFYGSDLIYNRGKDILVKSMRRYIVSLSLLILCVGAILSATGAARFYDRTSIPLEKDVLKDEAEGLLEGDFSLNVYSFFREGTPGSSVFYFIQVSTDNDLQGEVELSVSGLPTGAIGVFYPENVKLDLKLIFALQSTLIVTLDPLIPIGNYDFIIQGRLGDEVRTANASIHVVEEETAELTEEDFILKVTPTTQNMKQAGGVVRYNVEVDPIGTFDDKVSLSVRGLPDGSTVFFNPPEGKVDPTLKSKMTIITVATTPPGVYELLIFGIYRDMIRYTTAGLFIEEGVTTTATTTQILKRNLQVTTSTGKTSYLINETVRIFGYVQTFKGDSLPDAKVTIQVLDPAGYSILSTSVTSDSSGYYSARFSLDADSQPGTYSIYTTANHRDHMKGFSSTVFSVGKSLTPSITIETLYTTAVNGSLQDYFKPGETLIVWMSAVNAGAELNQGMIWVEVVDPKGVPIMVGVLITTIREGKGVKSGLQIVLEKDAEPGVYKASGFVSDGLISQGGRFLASKQIYFIVS